MNNRSNQNTTNGSWKRVEGAKGQILIPELRGQRSVQEYFSQLKVVNIANGTSYRQLTRAMSWPLGLLEDIIKQRRQLTIERALQFAVFAKFDEKETNRLVFLGIASGKEGTASQHFRHLLDSGLF